MLIQACLPAGVAALRLPIRAQLAAIVHPGASHEGSSDGLDCLMADGAGGLVCQQVEAAQTLHARNHLITKFSLHQIDGRAAVA